MRFWIPGSRENARPGTTARTIAFERQNHAAESPIDNVIDPTNGIPDADGSRRIGCHP